MEAMSWYDFVTRFRVEFASNFEVQQLVIEFQDLRHTEQTMEEITTKFGERDLLVMQYAMDDEIKMTRYHDMSLVNIQEFVSLQTYKTFDDMIARAREWEIEMQLRSKNEPEQVQITTMGHAKMPKIQVSRSGAIKVGSVVLSLEGITMGIVMRK